MLSLAATAAPDVVPGFHVLAVPVFLRKTNHRGADFRKDISELSNYLRVRTFIPRNIQRVANIRGLLLKNLANNLSNIIYHNELRCLVRVHKTKLSLPNSRLMPGNARISINVLGRVYPIPSLWICASLAFLLSKCPMPVLPLSTAMAEE